MSSQIPETVKASALRGYVEDVKKWVTESNVNMQDELGNSLLHIAASTGRYNVCEFLVNVKKCNLNLQNHIGDTALHKAAWRNNEDIVKLLVKKGADIKLVNKDKKTALDLAKEPAVCKLLGEEDEQGEDSEEE